MRQSVATSVMRGVSRGAQRTSIGVTHVANTKPTPAPIDDSTRLSTMTCCSNRERCAPSAARNASSR
jgi:hypothetical protein